MAVIGNLYISKCFPTRLLVALNETKDVLMKLIDSSS
jgi:hypothetical protein